jgi:hypothetical protein
MHTGKLITDLIASVERAQESVDSVRRDSDPAPSTPQTETAIDGLRTENCQSPNNSRSRLV